ncbi:MAG: PVC-type heme-binding CxxCH protein, partial [Planctomycetota bacterium]
DQANDVLVIGFPGQAARLYLNPGPDQLESSWTMFEVADVIDNESPAVVDIIPGELPEIVCGREGQYGFYSAGDDPTEHWTWNPVTLPGACGGRFAHALGVGDVNADGRLDILDKTYWWEQPGTSDSNEPWKKRQWANESYGRGGAQIRVDDIDGDGDSDIVTSLNAHGYGLAWFEQVKTGQFLRHDIMGESSTNNDYGIAFSQLHAVELVDIDGDGLKDIVTGKRWMAHNGKDPGGLQEPVLYWFQCNRKAFEASDGVQVTQVDFVPRLIDRDSGIGVDVLVTDLNADNQADVVSCSKRGLSVHLQTDALLDQQPLSWKHSAGSDQSKYADGLEPDEAARNMLVPEGFSVDLIASEPELTQPIAMCFDARGRIWVIEGHTYPTKAPEGKGRDRVVIFEDADSDGSFESKKTFATGLNLASGIEVGFGGVWIGAAPHLLFIPDADRDDVPDGTPQVLLDGWGYHDTHETLNSFTWGPDGWLYGCHGVFTHSNVGVPGALDSERKKLNGGVWRYHPTQHRFEVFSHGTSNPWGVDFNDQGEWFISACVIPHMYHIQKGARFQRQAGQHFNRHTYDDIKTIADHAHFAGNIRDHAFWGDNKKAMPAAPMSTSMLGGGHAHCGLAIYNGDAFPPEYDRALFFHNLHGHRLVRENLDRDGSGFVARHRPDFAFARDHKEIGVGVMVGPDGAIYTSDWHDIQTCHNRTPEVWDRTDGRLFRIRYGEVRPQSFDLWSERDEELVQRIKSDNAFFARQAQRILHERAAEGSLDTSAVIHPLDAIVAAASEKNAHRNRLRALWTKWCIDAINETDLVALMSHDDEHVRGWAVHFVGERITVGEPFGEMSLLAELARNDPSPVVRRYLASLLQDLSHDARWPIIEGLITRSIDLKDRNIPLLVWYGLEPLAAEDPMRAYEIARTSRWPDLLRFTIRRTTGTAEGREMLVARLADPSERGQRLVILEELNASATRRAGLEMPSGWPNAFEQLAQAPLPRVRQLTRSVAVQFGDQAVFPFFRSLLADNSKPKRQRLEALAALRTAKDDQLARQIFSLLGDHTISTELVSALAQFNAPNTADQLLDRFELFSAPTQTAALSTLVSRPESAAALITAMENGEIKPSTVPAFIVRQAVALGDEDLNARLEQTWGRISESSSEKKEQYARYQAILRPKAISAADPSHGRFLYEANCGKCHKLFGVGGDIGPDITGANRTNVDYWLENILEPNALIGKAYQVTSVLAADGRVVSGIIQEENEDAITIQTATEKVIIPQEEIDRTMPSQVSLMPEGQLTPMTDQQVQSLFKYLMGPSQVPLP